MFYFQEYSTIVCQLPEGLSWTIQEKQGAVHAGPEEQYKQVAKFEAVGHKLTLEKDNSTERVTFHHRLSELFDYRYSDRCGIFNFKMHSPEFSIME